MINNLIAPCGLDCETCDARIATINDDDILRAKTATKWCQLNNTDAIKPEHINCLGCMSDGIKTVFCTSMCQVRKCCLAKGFTSCAQCDNKRTCKDLSVFISNNPDAYERIINDYLFEKTIEARKSIAEEKDPKVSGKGELD